MEVNWGGLGLGALKVYIRNVITSKISQRKGRWTNIHEVYYFRDILLVIHIHT